MKLQLEDNLTFRPNQGSTSPPRDLFSCELCPKTFLHVEALRSHAKNHLLACLDCNKSFADQGGLTKHQEEVHAQEKSFHCSQCDKSFKELRTLRLHLKIHNSEYPEHCEVCKKGFRTKWQLKQHLMDHGGKRPYPCPECTFTCKTKQQLNEHRRKHSGEKAYSCPLCGTRFTYRNGLIKHTKLNRCPKKIVPPEGDRIAKKKTKLIDQMPRQKFDMINNLDAKARSEKSLLDQKILDVLQKRSAMKGHPGSGAQDLNNNSGALVRELVPGQIELPNCPSSSTTTTFLTNSTDISSWAATLPAGTKVTVTHYDASKKSGGGELVATPTHTETIIVTQPKESNRLPPSQQQQPLPLLRSRLSLPPPLTRHHTPEPALLDSFASSHFPEFPAVDPHDLLLKTEGELKQEPVSPPTYQPPVSRSNTPMAEVQLRAQALLAAVRPDPCFDPHMKIKKEFDHIESHTPSQTSPTVSLSPIHPPPFPSTNLHDIKKEVLSELFDDHEKIEDKSGFLDRQLSVKSEQEDEMVSDDFYDISFKLEPIASPHSNSSIGESDHDSFSFHRDLDAIVNNFSKSNEANISVSELTSRSSSSRPEIPVLPNLDLDFQNFFDDNISDVNMADQDFFQMNMDTFDAASELVSNV